MKVLKIIMLSACVTLVSFTGQQSSEFVSDKGTRWSLDNGTIVTEVSPRPAGQKSVKNTSEQAMRLTLIS